MIFSEEDKRRILERACRCIGLDYSNCEVLEISPQTYNRWRRGETLPAEKHLWEILDTFCILAEHVEDLSRAEWKDSRCEAVFLPHGFPKIPHRVDVGRKYRGETGRQKRIQESRDGLARKLLELGAKPESNWFMEFVGAFNPLPPDNSRTGFWCFRISGKTPAGKDLVTVQWQEGEETAGQAVFDGGELTEVHITPLPVEVDRGNIVGHWRYNPDKTPGKPFALWFADSADSAGEAMADEVERIRRSKIGRPRKKPTVPTEGESGADRGI